MNPIYESLMNRKSTRVFENKTIEPNLKSHILEAAFQAPTAGAQMLYSIIDVTDSSIKEKLAVTCDNQSFIAKAPMVLIFLADCRRWLDTYKYAGLNPRLPGVGDLFLAIQDAVIAAQNAVVAAESFGIGSCYIGDILENAEIHKDLLNLDPYVVPISMLVFGYPTEQQKDRQKPARFDRKYLVHENQYKRLNEAEHKKMLIERAQNPTFEYNTYIEKFCTRKYMSDFSLEMSRSSELYIENFMTQNKKMR
ncbi:nitroreductase family protein [Fusibacter tunisiensis]|uniref:FMN reductase (NADPH)/FMN reductase [NAD(P)H] n=1 Tax=Fusibacter tunisiensis TaxID=1008308 RepID=A0ABS2MMS8_9FIRM|nr:nitroreductase family protein [Fusibacter tunisiensis]MBM7560688.1 FMN reductase (NADPH)/FMN reductase [NAD(P)H] [Fusibacter tunisiensis]